MIAARAPRPVVNTSLIVLTALVFGAQLASGPDDDGVLLRWGLVPASVAPVLHHLPGADPSALVTLVSSAFLHASWLHLAANLVYLAVFGGAVEARLGHGRYGVFYGLCAVCGGLAFVLADPTDLAPTIGASAAVSGVIAGNLVLAPNATLGTLAPTIFASTVRNLPAVALLVLWVLGQVAFAIASFGSVTQVAWAAHLGGFAAGCVLAPLLRQHARLRW